MHASFVDTEEERRERGGGIRWKEGKKVVIHDRGKREKSEEGKDKEH